MAQVTQDLYPITTYWSLVSANCSTKPGYENKKIYFHPPVFFGCNAEWISSKFKNQYKNSKLTVVVGGSYGGWHTGGAITFSIYGENMSGTQLIYEVMLGDLSPVPHPLKTLDISEYSTIYFVVKAKGLTCTGCSSWIEPVYFTIEGEIPPANTYSDFQVNVIDLENKNPIEGATVRVLAPDYGYSYETETNSFGVAYINNVPFSNAETYNINVSKSGYRSSYVKMTGAEISSNGYIINIGLSKEVSSLPSLKDIEGIGITVAVVSGAVAGLYFFLKTETGKKIISRGREISRKLLER